MGTDKTDLRMNKPWLATAAATATATTAAAAAAAAAATDTGRVSQPVLISESILP